MTRSRGMKHRYSTGKSKTLKSRTVQHAVDHKRKHGCFPSGFSLRKTIVNQHTGETVWL